MLLQVGLEVDLLVAELADLLVEGPPGDAGDGVLARRVDLRQHEHVGLVEGGRKGGHELRQARVAVGLEDGHDAARPAALGRLERGLDLGRVVGVVLDDHDVVDDLAQLEAAARPGIALQRLEDRLRRDIEVDADGGRGHGVEDVVHPRDVELHRAQRLALIKDDRGASEIVESEVPGGKKSDWAENP